MEITTKASPGNRRATATPKVSKRRRVFTLLTACIGILALIRGSEVLVSSVGFIHQIDIPIFSTIIGFLADFLFNNTFVSNHTDIIDLVLPPVFLGGFLLAHFYVRKKWITRLYVIGFALFGLGLAMAFLS